MSSLLSEITQIWRNVLRKSDVDPKADFFDLGGDSLGMLSILMQVEQRFGVELTPGQFFEHSTLIKFSELASGAVGVKGQAPVVMSDAEEGVI